MLVINTNGSVRRVKYNGTIDQIYKEIGCELFDIVHVDLGNLSFDIYVDDEGLFKCNKKGEPNWNIKATHLRTIGWLERKDELVWDDALTAVPLAGNAVCLGCTCDGRSVDLPPAVNEFILDRLNEDVTMEEEKE